MKALRSVARGIAHLALFVGVYFVVDFVLPPDWFGWTTSAAAQSTRGCTLTSAVPCQNSFSNNGIQSFVTTYKYSSLGNTPAATPTDIFTITGSATKTIRVTKIVLSGFATTAGDLNPLIVRRSSANSGGTSTAPTGLARDIGFQTATPAAGATLALYTANPASLGTTVGTLDSCRLFLAVTTTSVPDVCVFSYGTNNDQVTVLRGTTDILAINFAGAAVPAGGGVDIDVEWTEEASGP